ncbi:hypothetical protein H7J06_20250 [Mycobacterium hodleri]|uniref:hypothetical protein n=1 Tax=Mycolicibacterium hodleri TaxID=49897 RepID=UPI0021F3B0D5|nr:hypothetical protein [Mycolicibacterium hodleri]MCV7135312.1 hypothetical protein [Mycolicibacterium hodleri]
MAAIAATLRAQAADSARDHASTAPAPEVSAAVATNESNIHSKLLAANDKNVEIQAANRQAVDKSPTVHNPGTKTESVSATC